MSFPPEDEVLFLTLHHLHAYDSDPAIASALNTLEHALNALHKLPTKHDYTGAQHVQNYTDIAARYPHIPPSYLNQILRARLPKEQHAPRTLLAAGRYSTTPAKLSSSRPVHYVRCRLRPFSSNVATLLDQQSILPSPPSLQHMSRALLPKAFRKLKRLVGHHLPVFTTLFDHTSRYIITGADDHLIKIWSAETAYLHHTLRGHDSDIIEIVKHPTRPIIVSASSDTTLRVWHLDTGAALHVLDGGSKEVNAVQFSPCPDRPYLVSGGADGSVRLWNGDDFEAGFIKIPTPNRFILRHATDTRQAGAANSHPTAFSPPTDASNQPSSQQGHPSTSTHPTTQDSQQPPPAPTQATATATAATRTTDSIRDNARHAANSVVSGTPLYEVLSVCFNAGATRLAISGTDCVAYVYAVEKSDSHDSPFPNIRLLTSLKGHSEHIIQVVFSRSGDTIVTACRDGTARMWRRTKARLPGARNKRESVVGMGSWSSKVLDCRSQIQADARSLLSGAASGSACGSIVPRLRRASFPVSLCAAMWSRSDKYLFTASTDTKIRIWHGETGQLARVLEAHESEVYVMDCHPTDDRILLSAGYDGKCILWDIETGAQLRSLSIANHLEEQGVENGSVAPMKRTSISDGQFSGDGLSFVVSDTSGAITLFGTGSGEATALAPEEQFFSDDCAPFRRDQKQRAIHESTGVLLHLASKGRLCNKELRPHPPELQPNVPLLLDKKATLALSPKDARQSNFPGSPNTIRNRNRDALLQRAKEFRENQEKEERRLLREARNARRRMILEKEKASLERDEPFYIPLRDFEVPDSDFEESDEDFDGEGYISGDSSSSSSSDEDDEEIDEQTHRKRRRQFNIGGPATESCLGLRARKRRISLRRSSRKLQRKDITSSKHESSESECRDESPGYVGSQDSDSDNSDLSCERRENDMSVSKKTETGKEHAVEAKEEPRISDGQISIVGQGFPLEAMASSSVKQQSASLIVKGLFGSSMTRSNRRMRIGVTGKDLSLQPAQTDASTPGAPLEIATETKVSPMGVVPNPPNHNGAQSIGSHHGQGQPCDTIGFAGFHTPLNPSFTSERKEDVDRTRRMSQPVEDHQGDTASCFRPRRVIEELVDRTRPSQRDHVTIHHSSAARSPETEKAQHDHRMEIDVKPHDSKVVNTISKHNSKADVVEKSVLSDSPARTTRRRWRNRTRRGSAGTENPETIDRLVDIDELAERELEILDAQRIRRHRRKRKKHSHFGSSDEDLSSEEVGRGHSKGHKVENSDGLKRQRRKIEKEGHGRADEENNLRPCLKGSTWLRLSSNKHTYVPQLGDDVLYFPEGHVAAMDVSKSMGLEPLMDKPFHRKQGMEVLDGTAFGNGATPLRFHIADLNYEFPTSTVSIKNSKAKCSRGSSDQSPVRTKTMVVLTLRLISGGRRRVGPNDRFVLCYFPVDAPEYLVLTSKVETALNRSWKALDRFRILILNESRAWQYYTGTIRTVKPTLRSVMWNTVEVEYDNTEVEKEKVSVELVSPWELEPHDLFHGSRDTAQPLSQMIRSSTVEPGLFPIIARELEAIRQLESNWRAQLSWLDTIDTIATIEGYCDSVPCPMDLDTVLVRMCTGYYRHFCSYMHDISLLKRNAIRFHGVQSEKGILANNVFTRIAETSERIRAQFLASFIPVAPTPHPYAGQQVGSNSTSRTIRPRPSPAELAGIPSQTAGVTNGRQFAVPLTPRQSNIGSATGLYYESSGPQVVNPALSSRMWNGIRLFPGVTQMQQHPIYPNTSLGVALPPVLPGVTSTGITSRGGRSVRGSGRGQAPRHSNGHTRRVNTTSLTRNQSLSPTHAAASSALTMAASSPFAMSLPYSPPHVNSGSYQQTQVRMVTNSSHTNNVRGAGHRVSHAGVRSQAGTLSKSIGQFPGLSSLVASQGTENMLPTSNRGYQPSGTNSPRLTGSAPHGAAGQISIGQPSTPGPLLRPNRAGSTAAEGGAHSWSRSMEGAGGTFPLHASTSDSHLPVPNNGRSRSPPSPSPPTAEAGTTPRQQGNSAALNMVARYHEHSTVSIAAAESTMSCGGAELQAATAESADVASERPSQKRRG